MEVPSGVTLTAGGIPIFPNCAICDPSGPYKSNITAFPLIRPVIVADERYEQKPAAVAAVMAPVSVAVLLPVFAPCSRLPVTLIVGLPMFAVDVNVP